MVDEFDPKNTYDIKSIIDSWSNIREKFSEKEKDFIFRKDGKPYAWIIKSLKFIQDEGKTTISRITKTYVPNSKTGLVWLLRDYGLVKMNREKSPYSNRIVNVVTLTPLGRKMVQEYKKCIKKLPKIDTYYWRDE